MSSFKVLTENFVFSTRGDLQFVNLTDRVLDVAAKSRIRNGVVHVFAPHATGIIILTENDNSLLRDIGTLLEKLVTKSGNFEHPSNAYAHLRSLLLPPDKTLPVVDGHVELGTWQSLFFVETDVRPRKRTVIVQVIGEV